MEFVINVTFKAMNFQKKIFSFVILFLALFTFSSCAQSEQRELEQVEKIDSNLEENVKIVTTLPPLYSLTAYLTEGVNVELTNILPNNVSIHTFQLEPATMLALSDADLVVINGLMLDDYLVESIDQEKVLVSSEGVNLLEIEEGHNHEHEDEEDHDHEEEVEHEHEDEHDEGHEDDHEHNHADYVYDPHVWLSVANAKIQAENIYEKLVELDEENLEVYEKNFRSLVQELNALEVSLDKKFSEIAFDNFLVFHDAYSYLENDFGFEITASFEESPGADPSAQYLSELIDLINEKNIAVVFSEPQFSPKLLNTLKEDYNLEVFEIDPLGKVSSQDSYFEMMNNIVEEFSRAFN